MSKGSKKDRLARVKELYDFDEGLATQAHGDTETPELRHGDTEIPKSGHGDTGTRGHENLSALRVSPSPRLLLAGFDEAGRGALAGPVVVGCVHFPFISATVEQTGPASASSSDACVESEPCSYFRQAVSDVPLATDSLAFPNPPVLQSPDHSIIQSLNDSIPPSPRVSLSPRPAFLEYLAGVDDSKRLTARQRETLFPHIKAHSIWGVGSASAEEIDALGIVPAVSLAARRAYRAMGTKVDLLLCDRGLTLLRDSAIEGLNHLTPQASDSSIAQSPDHPTTQFPNHSITESFNPPISRSLNHSIAQSTELSFTRGDSRSLHIAAASIIAKVMRDQMMVDLDSKFPGYGFAKHKGYGTAVHLAALRKLGPSPIHRRSFKVRNKG